MVLFTCSGERIREGLGVSYRPSAKIRDKTVRSLSIYLRRLEEVEAKGVPTIFTQRVEHVDLAAAVESVSFNQVRQKRRCPHGSQVGRGV